MSQAETTGTLEVEGVSLAWRRVAGGGPTLVWLGGFRSEMSGAKSDAVAEWAQSRGRDFLRFDYFGHGASGGDFAEATITRWRGDVLAMIDRMTSGPLVLVGSSMGGWLACLAALARPKRTGALVLVAPAADFTSALLEPGLSDEARTALARQGVWMSPSDYDPEGYPITARLLEDGARWSILPGPIPISVPARILQGGADTAVPWRHALELARVVKSEDVVFTLIRDGDHRLSRPQDLARLVNSVTEAVSVVEA